MPAQREGQVKSQQGTQPDSHHHGKTPERAEKRETETHTISDLEQQLSLAVAREDYERAAKLRDQIKQLRTPTN